MDTLTPQEILDTIAPPAEVRTSHAPAPSRLPAIIVALVVIAVGSLSMWYLLRPQPLLVQGEVDATGFDIAARIRFAEWEEWINLVLGLWVLVSPWVLGFTAQTNARWTHVIVGLIVAVLAGVKLWFIHQTPPQVTARRCECGPGFGPARSLHQS